MAVATKAFFDMTFDDNTTEAILFGDACYNVSGPMAEISRQWGMFQVNLGFLPLWQAVANRATVTNIP